MTLDDERERKLRDFGLSEYAARAYLALLDLGTTEARDISRLGRVPIAKVYSTLEQLQERGLVIVEPGPPKRFTPAPFAAFIERKRARLLDEARELERAASDAERTFRARATAPTRADDRGGFIALRGRESVREKIATSCLAAEREVLILAADHFTGRNRGSLDRLREMHTRGVTVRILASPTEDHAALHELARHATLRAKRLPAGLGADVTIVIVDGKQAILAHVVPNDRSSVAGKDVGLVIEETGLVEAQRAMLEALWADAPPLAEALEAREIVLGGASASDPAPFSARD